MKKVLLALSVVALGFIVLGCGTDKCDEYVDLVCEKCGADSDVCKNMEGAQDEATAEAECDEEAAQTAIDDLESKEGDDLDAFCEAGAI